MATITSQRLMEWRNICGFRYHFHLSICHPPPPPPHNIILHQPTLTFAQKGIEENTTHSKLGLVSQMLNIPEYVQI
jgi:hypothetical protein